MLYLAYGSNLHPRRLRARTPSARLVGSAHLDGWSLHFRKRGQDGSGKCSILEGGSGVHVAVYEICQDDLLRLDAIEGVGRGYVRETVSLTGFGSCHTYIAESDYVDDALLPFDWYRELVVQGASYLGFDGAYVDRLRQHPTCLDPDARRHEAHWALLREIHLAE